MSTTVTETVRVEVKDDTNDIPSGDVNATIKFFYPPEDGSAPYNLMRKHLQSWTEPNYPLLPQTVPITDIRGHESEYSLDKHGFQAASNISSAADPSFTDEENIKSVWYPEIEELVRKFYPDAKRVFAFNHIVRRSDPGFDNFPLISAHVDQTMLSAEYAIRALLPEDAEELLKDRFRALNVWCPINGPVLSTPLAVALPSSVPDDDLVRIDLKYPEYTSESLMLRYNPEHKWYYWSGMTNGDRLSFMIADSKEDAVARRTAHSAFYDPRTPTGAKGRDSIETRVFVFG